MDVAPFAGRTCLRAGDTILVKEGTYDVGASPNWAAPAVGPVHSGTADAPITFRACPGDRVTITTSGGQAAIGSNRDYVVWDGFVVDMTDRMKGIIIFGARGCVVRYCEVKGNHIDSGDSHDGIRIERAADCRIHHNVIHGVKYNLYDARPTYNFGEYTPDRQRLSLDDMRSKGFKVDSRVVSSPGDVFEDETTYQLLPRWKTTGRRSDPLGPDGIALVLDLSRHGPRALSP